MDKKLTKDEIREILRKPKMREVVKQIANETAILMNKKSDAQKQTQDE